MDIPYISKLLKVPHDLLVKVIVINLKIDKLVVGKGT